MAFEYAAGDKKINSFRGDCAYNPGADGFGRARLRFD
jgi:hypothetical protein